MRVRLRGRPEDHDEIVPVARLDEPEGPFSTRTVELAPRGRGRELLLVAAVVAVVAGVGLLGDGGEDDIAATPSTTSARRAVDKPEAERRPKSSTTRRPRTTTTWPQFEAGIGQLLPGPPTSTHIGTISGSGTVTVVDLDTGDRCETRPSQQGVWGSWHHQAPTGHLIVQTGSSVIAIDRVCAMTPLSVDVEDPYVAAATDDRVWLTNHLSPYLNEIALPGGEATGRTVEVPRFNMATVFAAGDNVVVAAAGDMTLVDPDDGTRRALGVGQPLATWGDVLAYVTCPEARCRLGLMDILTGRRQLVGDIEPVPWNSSTFSPDGRFLLVSVAGARSDQPIGAIVDTRTGSAQVLDSPIPQGVFTADSRWLIGVSDNRLEGYRVDAPGPGIPLKDLNGVQNLALL